MPKFQEKRATKKNKAKETFKKYGKYTQRNIRNVEYKNGIKTNHNV